MRPLERATRAIVESLPTTVDVGDSAIAVDIGLLRDLRRALAVEAYQQGSASVAQVAQVATWPFRHTSMTCGEG